MTSTRRDPLVGAAVDDRYEVLERIARGGMSTVYRALDVRLDREVALKVMHPHLAEYPDLVGRFEREAKTAARLSHPHVVAVLDQGHTVSGDGEVLAYLVMEHVPGTTLRTLIHSEAPLPPRRAVELLRPVVDGLAAAHRAGLVHRDVKPENVLVRVDGRITVADFGLTRASSGHTSAGQALVGTPAYLAPEHISGGQADARADVYAVGIILFELLTGRQPYTAATPLQVAYRHVHERVPVPSTLVPGLPEALDDLVLWCTEPDPEDRPADADELLAELDRVSPALPATEAVPDGATPDGGDDDDEDDDDDDDDEHATHALPTFPVGSTRVLPERAPAARHAQRALGADAPEGRPVRRRRSADRRESRRPAVTLGAGNARTVVIGTAVTLLLTGLALMLGWALGTGGLGRMQAASMPSLEGLAQEDARALLAEADVAVEVTQRHDERYSDGTVLASSPAAGTALRPRSTVLLTLSDGPAPVPAPDLTGLTVRAAHQAADAGRVVVTVAERRTDLEVPAGSVLSQSPAPGTEMERGTPVRVVLSEGVARHAVPDLRGVALGEARTRLEEMGFRVEVSDVPFLGPLTGEPSVLSQSPDAGTELDEGTLVRLRTL